jgi:hypothetical protein
MAETINVRGVDGVVWRAFRAAAVTRGVTVGALLTDVLGEWLTTLHRAPLDNPDPPVVP